MTQVRASDVRVQMHDGVRLATDVVTADGSTPRPAMVIRGPHSRAAARMETDIVGLVRRGWAVVVQDVRGRYDSEGEFDPFHQERHDGADTIAWIAGQPWCDGRVASMGSSYLGLAQWAAAAAQPPALRAIASLVSGGEVRDTWVYEGGALQLGFVVPWAINMAATAPAAPPEDQQRAADLAADWHGTFRTPVARQPLRALFPPFERWLDREDDAYWQPLDLGGRRDRLDVPALHVTGWYDIFCEGTIDRYVRMRAEASSEYARDSQRLIVGPWAHTGVFASGTAGFDFGEMASATVHRFADQTLDWLAEAVDGKPVDDAISIFVMGSGKWRDHTSWPPTARPIRLYLSSQIGANSVHGDGVLLTTPTEATSTEGFRYDPDDPVPSRGGRSLGPFHPLAGPVDQRPVEERDDVLVYTTPPLPVPVTVIGKVTAHIVFATEGHSADVTVKLVDVWADGRAYNVVDSVRRAGFTPGLPQAVEVAVGSTAMCFRAGHRIRVEISSSNFPRLDRNPSTGTSIRDAQVLKPAWQTVYHGGRAASYITLPVVEG
ncbi:MAG: CocE/NonD family hydrolase [Actinobacteria bacterium]|nr:CocE/NonD family hydrolase [Actinomycetota bacterium]